MSTRPLRRARRRAGLRAFASSALLAAAAPAAASPVTWDTGDGGNGNTYDVIVNNTISWDDARAAAKAAGGDLATIDSAAEQSFVESVLSTNVAATGSYWFGIREGSSEGVWQDVTGKNLAFTHWAPGEPNNAVTAESAGAILWSADGAAPADAGAEARKGGWNDAPNSGYPILNLGLVPADAQRAGFLVELPTGSGTGGGGTGGGGGTDNGGGTGGGGTNAAPLPAALYAFPVGAAFAGIFYHRMRRRA